jgi:hypothetical protein
LQRRSASFPCGTSAIQARQTRPFRRRIAHNRLRLPSELGVGGRNPANQAVRPSPSYL